MSLDWEISDSLDHHEVMEHDEHLSYRTCDF